MMVSNEHVDRPRGKIARLLLVSRIIVRARERGDDRTNCNVVPHLRGRAYAHGNAIRICAARISHQPCIAIVTLLSCNPFIAVTPIPRDVTPIHLALRKAPVRTNSDENVFVSIRPANLIRFVSEAKLSAVDLTERSEIRSRRRTACHY